MMTLHLVLIFVGDPRPATPTARMSPLKINFIVYMQCEYLTHRINLSLTLVYIYIYICKGRLKGSLAN